MSRIAHRFKPKPYQLKFLKYFEYPGEPLKSALGKRAIWVMHRRGGKDMTAMHALCLQAHLRIGMYWHVFPSFEQGRKAIWEGFTDQGERILDVVFPPEMVKRKNQQQMMIEFNCGSIYRIIGSDNIEVVGAGPCGVVFSEFALAKPKADDLISPMLMQNNGWAVYITTPRGRNHAWKKYESLKADPAAFAELLTLHDTKAYDPEATIAQARREGRPEAIIRQEYLCDWTAANVGSVWGDLVESLERRGAVVEFAHPGDGVFTSWDLGHTDATAIWFWRLNEHRAPDLIDHYEAHGKPMSHYFDVVDGRGYSYVKHCLPHDARAKTLQTGSSILEQAMAHWPGKVTIVPQLSVADGIQAGRWLLQLPMRIHTRCGEGIEALRQYHYEYDEDTKSFAVKPEHDWSSHTADAFRYLACVVKYAELTTRPPEQPKPVVVGPLDRAFNLDQLFADNEKDKARRRI